MNASHNARIAGPDLAGPGRIETLAKWVAARAAAPCLDDERRHALRAILDLIGSAAAGRDDRAVQAVRTAARALSGPGMATVWFSGEKLRPAAAAWINATAASALDLDDGQRLARGHPGAAIIPAALALAEELNAQPEQLLQAIVTGYEVGLRVGAARRSYGNSGCWTPAGVVAAAGVLHQPPAEIIAHALAIALESAPNQIFSSAPLGEGQPAPEGSHVKEGIPWSVMTGLQAFALAMAGHTGPRNLLDATARYDFSAQSPTDPPRIGACYFKLYACCRHIHAPLDALFDLMSEHSLQPQDIEAIEIASTSGALRISNSPRPGNLTELQYSVPYCMALAVLEGPGVFQPARADTLGRPEAEALAAKVSLSIDPEADAAFPARTLARVVLHSRKGRFASGLTAPKGEASAPLSQDALEAKYATLTEGPTLAQIPKALRAAIENPADSQWWATLRNRLGQ